MLCPVSQSFRPLILPLHLPKAVQTIAPDTSPSDIQMPFSSMTNTAAEQDADGKWIRRLLILSESHLGQLRVAKPCIRWREKGILHKSGIGFNYHSSQLQQEPKAWGWWFTLQKETYKNNQEVCKIGMAHQAKSVTERGKIPEHQHPSPAAGCVHSQKGLWAVLASLPGRDMSSVLPTSHLASESQHILSQMLGRWGWGVTRNFFILQKLQDWHGSSFYPCPVHTASSEMFLLKQGQRQCWCHPLPQWFIEGDLPRPPRNCNSFTFPRKSYMKVDSKEPCKI